MVPGGYIGTERAKVMDEERIDITLVYPSLGLLWEYDCPDVKVAAANCRAYNDWVFDFCSEAPTRLVPVAHIPMADVDEAIKEMKRTAALGAKAMMMGSDCTPGTPYGHPYFDPLWAEAEALEMPMTIHPSTGSNSVSAVAYPKPEDQTAWWLFLYGGETVKLNFSSFFNHGTFDRFPDLKVVILESGIGWLVWWLDRMDEKFEVNGFHYSDEGNSEHLLQAAGVHIDGPGREAGKAQHRSAGSGQVHVGLRLPALGLDIGPGEGAGGESGRPA